jgi:hypothetical protein
MGSPEGFGVVGGLRVDSGVGAPVEVEDEFVVLDGAPGGVGGWRGGVFSSCSRTLKEMLLLTPQSSLVYMGENWVFSRMK